MGSVYLPDFVENAEIELEIFIPAAERGDLDFKKLQQLCFLFRQRGVCRFLLSGDPQPLFVNFMQSASAYTAYLPSIDDGQRATSQAKPFYDAIGGGFWDSAAAIAMASRKTWNRAKEYEDDFLFVLFLMKHFFLKAADDECRAVLAAHEAAAEGEDQSHRDVGVAFIEKDGPRFDAALRVLLDERSKRVEGMVEREAMPEESWSWLRYFSSEGLALLKLADRVGLAVGTEYLHVSEGLRANPTFAFDPDAWRRLKY
jgi:hypothetical protein